MEKFEVKINDKCNKEGGKWQSQTLNNAIDKLM